MSTRKSPAKKTAAKKTAAKNPPAKKAATKEAAPAAVSPPAPAVPKIPFKELEEMVLDGRITERELAPYFDQVPGAADSFQPKLILNENVTQKPPEEKRYESALALNTANYWAYQARKNQYRKKIKALGGKGIRIVAEGDSWFQYPIMLHDVIDHLADKPEIAVRCFSAAGDILSNMVARPQFLEALATEDPKFLLLSGGGNDLVDGKGLRLLLRAYQHGRPAKDYFNEDYDAFKKRIARNYADIFKMTRAENKKVIILCHGYDYAIPNNGPWLGRPMGEIGITDKGLQFQIMKLIVDDIHKVISTAVKASKDPKIHYVDMRGSVPATGWKDEFHPTSSDFGGVADRFYKKIKSL